MQNFLNVGHKQLLTQTNGQKHFFQKFHHVNATVNTKGNKKGPEIKFLDDVFIWMSTTSRMTKREKNGAPIIEQGGVLA